MAIIEYNQAAPLPGFQQWLWQQGIQYCQQQSQSRTQQGTAVELSAEAWDNLSLSVWSSASGVTVRFLGEYVLPNGSVQHFARDIVPTSDRAINTVTLDLPTSQLLSMQALLAVGSAKRGEVYVRAVRQAGTGTGATLVGNTLAGYVTNTYSPSWPGGPVEDSVVGPGVIKVVTGTDPAAGAEVTETVPTGARWRLWSMCTRLVTSGTAATRRAHYEVTSGGTRIFIGHPEKTQTASNTNDYIWGTNMSIVDATTNVNAVGMIPQMPLLAGWVINTVTTAIQAGDNWGAPQMIVEEWIEA